MNVLGIEFEAIETLEIRMGSGVFTINFEGQTTNTLLYNASASEVQAAFESLSTVGSGNVSVTGNGNSFSPWTFTFQVSWARKPYHS